MFSKEETNQYMSCGKEDKINCQSLKYKQNNYSMRKVVHI